MAETMATISCDPYPKMPFDSDCGSGLRKNDHKTLKTTETKGPCPGLRSFCISALTVPRPKKFLYQRPYRMFGRCLVRHQCASIEEPIRSMACKTPEPAPTCLDAVVAVQTDKAFDAVVAESRVARLRSTSRGRQWPMTWQPYHVIHILGCPSTQTAVEACMRHPHRLQAFVSRHHYSRQSRNMT